MPAVFVKVVDITADERGPKVGASASHQGRARPQPAGMSAYAACAGHPPPDLPSPPCSCACPFPCSAPQIGCSIKHVSQSDGTDLDPSNTKYRPRGEGGGFQVRGPWPLHCLHLFRLAHARQPRSGTSGGANARAPNPCQPTASPATVDLLLQGQQPIGAKAGTAHDGAVEWGYLKADVVQYGAGGQQYDILAGDSGDERGGGPSGPGGRALPPQRPPPPGMASGANMAPLPPRLVPLPLLPVWVGGVGRGWHWVAAASGIQAKREKGANMVVK